MSVARSSHALSNEYQGRVYHPAYKGLNSTAVFDVAASPSMAIAFGNVLVSTTTTYRAWKSTNGIDWSMITSSPNTAINALAYGNNTFVAVGAAGVIYTSPGTDGETWTARTKAGSSAQEFNFIKFLNGYFWAKQASANMQYSSDGVTWTELTSSNFQQASSTAHLNAKLQNLTYASDIYIFWTGITATTSQARIYYSNASAVTSGWSNRIYSDTIVTTSVLDDPGDGMGEFIKIGTTLGATTFSRTAREFVSGNFATSGINSIWGSGARLFQVVQQASATQGPIPYVSTDGQAVYLKYTDGTYLFAYPAQATYANQGAHYGIAYSNFTEDTTIPLSGSYPSDQRARFIPLYSDTNWATSQARFNRSFELGGKVFVWWGFNTSNNDHNYIYSNSVVVFSRAIRPIKTTIDTR